MFGWSYGGYMTSMLLAKASNEIAAGVAVAPVTDWSLYDTFYTERYLATPQDNANGYELSSVLHWLDGLKSPLLLTTAWPMTTCCSRTRRGSWPHCSRAAFRSS